jgi:putative ABC transport system permease protein
MVNQLFGVRPDDPPTFVVVTVILAASAVFAAWLPVARAVRVDPVVALRHE